MPKEIPTAIAVLPTCGKIYSHTSLMNKEGLEIRAMKVKELDIFNSQAYLKQGVVIDKIIKACLIDKAVPVDELISADKDSLMLSIRVLSYGKDFTQENIKCPNCDNEEKVYKFDLTKSSFDKLEINPIEPNTNIFEFTLPKSEKKIKWKLMTSTDEKDLEQTMESRTKKGLEENGLAGYWRGAPYWQCFYWLLTPMPPK